MADPWDLRKDAEFNTFISQAVFDEQSNIWNIFSSDGKQYSARYLLITGFAAKRHIPDWKGIDNFQGTWIHPSYWPKDEPDLRGKMVAMIGTGSTGVQLAQELSQVASEFALLQRTPNMALPIKQINFKESEPIPPKNTYAELSQGRRNSFGGFNFNFTPGGTF